jgi:adenine phosphoribosyltransferase
MTDSDQAGWIRLVRDIADFPRPGIVFKDIAPVLANAEGFGEAIESMAAPWRTQRPDAVLGIEARGFILGAPLARLLGVGFVPLRKPGKLPGRTITQAYALEYGEDALQLQADALPVGARVVLIDDVLATGGTLSAAQLLAERMQLHVLGAGVLIELSALEGRARWRGSAPLHAAWTL